jgi:hypothetical protein
MADLETLLKSLGESQDRREYAARYRDLLDASEAEDSDELGRFVDELVERRAAAPHQPEQPDASQATHVSLGDPAQDSSGAFLGGREAYREGKTAQDCPYAEGSADAGQWAEGFRGLMEALTGQPLFSHDADDPNKVGAEPDPDDPEEGEGEDPPNKAQPKAEEQEGPPGEEDPDDTPEPVEIQKLKDIGKEMAEHAADLRTVKEHAQHHRLTRIQLVWVIEGWKEARQEEEAEAAREQAALQAQQQAEQQEQQMEHEVNLQEAAPPITPKNVNIHNHPAGAQPAVPGATLAPAPGKPPAHDAKPRRRIIHIRNTIGRPRVPR